MLLAQTLPLWFCISLLSFDLGYDPLPLCVLDLSLRDLKLSIVCHLLQVGDLYAMLVPEVVQIVHRKATWLSLESS